MENGTIIVILGVILTLTIICAIVGLPLILYGAYLLNKRVSNPTDKIQKQIKDKQRELDKIDDKLSKMESDKKTELEELEKKKKEVDNIKLIHDINQITISYAHHHL